MASSSSTSPGGDFRELRTTGHSKLAVAQTKTLQALGDLNSTSLLFLAWDIKETNLCRLVSLNHE